ncbi:FUSC family protein [Actinomadura sp. 9N407]|uniref:FUSC family protein n=1 Tax=Actinomadura sp. 9N407 TaxID=3375154 RepID=UPI0037B138A0
MTGTLHAVRGRKAYWQERAEITVKAVAASVLAWLAARWLLDHQQPYFAPLAALLGVYPTIARSLRESLGYAAGFLAGGLLAIPVGLLIGPNALGIAAVLVVALVVSEWKWFGDQASQVAFTALFALLVGGHEVVSYVLPRLADVAVGLVVGLSISAVVFPPVRLSRAENALLGMRDTLSDATARLAEAVTEEDGWWSHWREHERQLLGTQDQAHRAYDHGRESLRANPRARLRGYRARWQEASGPWPAPRLLNALDQATANLRSIAGTLREANDLEDDTTRYDPTFRGEYAHLMRCVAELIRKLPELADAGSLEEADGMQKRLEAPHRSPGTDGPGLWDPQKELLRLSRRMLDDVRTPMS